MSNIDSLWQPLSLHFAPCGVDLLSTDDLSEKLREFFESYFGVEETKRRFSLPKGYLSFLQHIKRSHVSQSLGGWDFYFYGPSSVLSNTKYSFELFGKDEDSERDDAGIWIEIGAYNDKHTYFLCCDRDRSDFRQIVDGHDSHPWLNGAERPDYRTIEALLKSLAR